jgi:putative membrane protein
MAEIQEPIKKTGITKDNNYMAADRTLMAADRSLMAWIRTGLSLISFGFTIYKFLEYQYDPVVTAGNVLEGASGPRITGLIMIGMGILCLVLGTIEYLMIVRDYKKEFEIKRPSYSLFVAAAIAVLGIVLFAGIIFRINGIG